MSWRALFVLGALLLAPTAALASGRGKISVVVDGVRDRSGALRFALFATPRGFPGKHQLAMRSGSLSIRGRTVRFQIDAVPHGTYALTVLHDENGNEKMDTNWIGIPKEGGGASRNPRPRFGPPAFDDASFVLRGPALEVKIQMRYPR